MPYETKPLPFDPKSMIAVTAVVGLVAYPILQPTWGLTGLK